MPVEPVLVLLRWPVTSVTCHSAGCNALHHDQFALGSFSDSISIHTRFHSASITPVFRLLISIFVLLILSLKGEHVFDALNGFDMRWSLICAGVAGMFMLVVMLVSLICAGRP